MTELKTIYYVQIYKLKKKGDYTKTARKPTLWNAYTSKERAEQVARELQAAHPWLCVVSNCLLDAPF
jgi:neutral trehalase